MNTGTKESRVLVIATLAVLFASPGGAATPAEIQKLLAGDGSSFDEFGDPIAIDGDTAVIGARLDDPSGFDSGSAYVFTRGADGLWSEQQKLIASDGAGSDFFGLRVAVDGDTIVVGSEADDDDGSSSGSAYVFTRNGGVWTEQQKLTASDAAAGDWFGSAVAVDGDTAVIGAERDDDNGNNSGSAYVFTRNGGVWTEQQKLLASNGNDFDFFGDSMAMDGDTVVIGARFGDVGGSFSDFGTAYVFTFGGGNWTEQQMLSASDRAFEDQFGRVVAVDGDTVVAGAHQDNDNGTDSGSAYVFTRAAGVWTEQQKLTASDGEADEEFGYSVAVAGDTAVIGALMDDEGGNESGSAYVFSRSDGVWSEQGKLVSSDIAAFDEFGTAVAASADTIMIGATREDENGSASGSAYVFAPGPTLPAAATGTDSIAVLDSGSGNSTVQAASQPESQQSGDAAALLRTLDAGTIRVEMREMATGNLLNNIDFLGASFEAVSVVTLADSNGNGADELAVLATRKSDGLIVAQVRDSSTDARITNATFLGTVFNPVDMKPVPDLNNNGADELALLAINSSDNRFVVQIRDGKTGDKIRNIYFLGPTYQPIDLVVIPDSDNNGSPELGVLARNRQLNNFLVQVKNASGPSQIRNIFYLGATFEPQGAIVTPDMDNDGVPEIAVLAKRSSDSLIAVQARNAFGVASPKTSFYLTANYAPVGLAAVNDSDSDGVPEVAVLARRPSDGRFAAEIRNLTVPRRTRIVFFMDAAWEPVGLIAVDDVDGNNVPDVGALGRRTSNDRRRLHIRNAFGSPPGGVNVYFTP